jgi:protein-disulfide isomerase
VTSGKQAKRRRAGRVPPPPVRSKAAPRRASPRVLIGAAVVLVLAVVGVVVGIALTGGSSKSDVPTRGSLVNALPGAADVQREFTGIPQRGNVLGSPSAPVTMIEYIDLQCPFCQQFEVEAMPTVISRYVRPGKLRVEARLIAFIGPDSERGRKAAIAAGEQRKLFNFTQLLYLNQGPENSGWLDDEMVTSAAASIPGLDVPRLLDDRNSSAVEDEANRFDMQATSDNVRQTPTILIGRSGATPREVAAVDIQTLSKAIEAALP